MKLLIGCNRCDWFTLQWLLGQWTCLKWDGNLHVRSPFDFLWGSKTEQVWGKGGQGDSIRSKASCNVHLLVGYNRLYSSIYVIMIFIIYFMFLLKFSSSFYHSMIWLRRLRELEERRSNAPRTLLEMTRCMFGSLAGLKAKIIIWIRQMDILLDTVREVFSNLIHVNLFEWWDLFWSIWRHSASRCCVRL